MYILIVLIILCILFILYCMYENKNLEVTDYILEQTTVPKAFDNMRFVCLTDLHLNQFGKNNVKLLNAIRGCKPDVILVAGDMIIAAKTKNSHIALELLTTLAKEYPVYYAPGNHELKWSYKANDPSSGYSEYIEKLKDSGICYLDNQEIQIKKGKDTLHITGLNLPVSYYNKASAPKELTMEALNGYIGTAKEGEYSILLAHVPDYAKQYAAWGADFTLSGHNHGGIVQLGKLGGVISPRYQLFPNYDSGVYEENGSVMFLSRGLGTHTIPVRMFNRPEVISVLIKRKQKSGEKKTNA